MCGMKCVDTDSMHNSLKATFFYMLHIYIYIYIYIQLTIYICVCVCKQCTYDNTALFVVTFNQTFIPVSTLLTFTSRSSTELSPVSRIIRVNDVGSSIFHSPLVAFCLLW